MAILKLSSANGSSLARGIAECLPLPYFDRAAREIQFEDSLGRECREQKQVESKRYHH